MDKSTKQLCVYASATDRQLGIKTPLETFENPTWWQLKGLSYTATGYGNKIPTYYMVKHNGRMKRVYCRIFANIGTCYIVSNGRELIIDD